MKYEQPNMEIIIIKAEDVVTSSLNGGVQGPGTIVDMPEGW